MLEILLKKGRMSRPRRVGADYSVCNVNLDVGESVPVGGYAREDKAWLNLCARLDAGGNRTVVDPGLAEAIQAHFDGMDTPCRVELTERADPTPQ